MLYHELGHNDRKSLLRAHSKVLQIPQNPFCPIGQNIWDILIYVWFIQYFRLLVFDILVTLAAWFFFRFFLSCPSCLAKWKQRLRNISVFCNFVAKSDQKPKQKMGWMKQKALITRRYSMAVVQQTRTFQHPTDLLPSRNYAAVRLIYTLTSTPTLFQCRHWVRLTVAVKMKQD